LEQIMNPMAEAWKKGAEEIGFVLISPFSFTGRDGRTYSATGYLPHFGDHSGALIVSRFDDDGVAEAGDEMGYYVSGLSPDDYEKYQRGAFLETLNDWGWWGPGDHVPSWFRGKIKSHRKR
jgi:hypothetical protein